MKFLITMAAGAVLLLGFQNVDGDTLKGFLALMSSSIDDPWLFVKRAGTIATMATGVIGTVRTAAIHKKVLETDFGSYSPSGRTSSDQDSLLRVRYVVSVSCTIAGYASYMVV